MENACVCLLNNANASNSPQEVVALCSGKRTKLSRCSLLHLSEPSLAPSNKYCFVKIRDFIYRMLQLLLDLASKVGITAPEVLASFARGPEYVLDSAEDYFLCK